MLRLKAVLPMKILSLFDGISCSMLALQRADISVEEYHAFEIDKYALSVSQRNFPEIVHHGNVFDGDYTEFKGFDLLIGGSPRTYWSIAKKDRETISDGMGFKLFMEYVMALRESGCRYFLYENNFSIHQNIKDEISKRLGAKSIVINSALVSGQHRQRCYWTNIPNVTQPADKGILLADILENGILWQQKSYCMTANYHTIFQSNLERHQNSMVRQGLRLSSLKRLSILFRLFLLYSRARSLFDIFTELLAVRSEYIIYRFGERICDKSF